MKINKKLNRIIGIIGKSGSGKSTVAKYIAEKYNFAIIDLDQIAKEIVEIYPAVLEEITEIFGSAYVIDGKLDRQSLGKLVFGNELELAKLNQVFFKFIIKEIQIRASKLGNCILEGAVLSELGITNMLDKLIFIQSSDIEMLGRLQKRENTPKEVLQKRLERQQKYDSTMDSADFIIVNDGSPIELQTKIDKVMVKVLKP